MTDDRYPVNNESHMSCGEFPWDSQIFSHCETRHVRITTISQWPHLMWLTECGSHGPFKISHKSHMSSQFVSFCESFLARLSWYVCYLMYVCYSYITSQFNICEIFLKVFCDTYDSQRMSFVSLPRWNHLEILKQVFCDRYDSSRGTFVSLARWNRYEIFIKRLLWWICFLTGKFCETRSVKSLWHRSSFSH